jgi:hypothetical protein
VWRKCWDHCIHTKEDYFEGGGRQNWAS